MEYNGILWEIFRVDKEHSDIVLLEGLTAVKRFILQPKGVILVRNKLENNNPASLSMKR